MVCPLIADLKSAKIFLYMPILCHTAKFRSAKSAQNIVWGNLMTINISGYTVAIFGSRKDGSRETHIGIK